MNKLGLAKVLGTLIVSTLFGALSACYGDAPESAPSIVAEAASPSIDSAIVGKWQFVYDARIRSFHETRMAAEIKDPTGLAHAKREAEEEAAASVIQFTEEGEYFSWVNGELVFQAPYTVEGEGTSVRLSMKAKGETKTTTVALHGDQIVIDDPTKGPLTFRRVK